MYLLCISPLHKQSITQHAVQNPTVPPVYIPTPQSVHNSTRSPQPYCTSCVYSHSTSSTQLNTQSTTLLYILCIITLHKQSITQHAVHNPTVPPVYNHTPQAVHNSTHSPQPYCTSCIQSHCTSRI
jgi:hypothetical protein